MDLRGTCIKGVSFNLQIDQGSPNSLECLSGQFDTSVDLPGADGPKAIVIVATGADGRERRDSVTILKDTVAPAVAILSAMPTADYLVLSGTCEATLPLVSGGDIQNLSSNVCNSGVFQVSARLTSSTGAKTLRLSQTDKAGNNGATEFQWNPDNPYEPAGTHDRFASKQFLCWFDDDDHGRL